MQPLKDSLECAVIAPVTKPLIHRRPRAKALWQVSPSCARAQDPEDAVEHQAIIAAGASHFLRGGNQIRDQLPSSIGKFVTLCHAGLQPFMASILPVRTFRTEPKVASEIGVKHDARTRHQALDSQ